MAKSASPSDSQKARLEKELAALIPEIREEGLLFLIQQASTIIHNQRIEVINRESEVLRKKKGGAKASPTEEAPEVGFSVEITRSADGKTYYFTVNGRKHFFDAEETRRVVDLCYRPPAKSVALKYLYQFFQSERDEILAEHKIRSEASPFFQVLFTEVRAVFSPK